MLKKALPSTLLSLLTLASLLLTATLACPGHPHHSHVGVLSGMLALVPLCVVYSLCSTQFESNLPAVTLLIVSIMAGSSVDASSSPPAILAVSDDILDADHHHPTAASSTHDRGLDKRRLLFAQQHVGSRCHNGEDCASPTAQQDNNGKSMSLHPSKYISPSTPTVKDPRQRSQNQKERVLINSKKSLGLFFCSHLHFFHTLT